MKKKRKPISLTTLFIIIFIIWVISIIVINKGFPNLADRGVFGDSFGSISSLFSGLALGVNSYEINPPNPI